MSEVEMVKTKIFDEDRQGYIFLCFRDARQVNRLHVYTRTKGEMEKNPDGYGDCLCEVRKSRGEKWVLEEVHEEYPLPRSIANAEFDTRERAAEFYFLYITNLKREKESHPLPDDITRFLKDRSRELREKRQQLETEFHRLVAEQRQFGYFARKYGVNEIAWDTEDADAIAACQQLIDYCPDEEYGVVPDEERKTLIDFVYDKWGKDAGRTYRALLRKALKFADPAVDP